MVDNTYIVLQARMNSERLPNKVMKEIAGEPLIGILFRRLADSGIPILLATSKNKENDELAAYAKDLGIITFRGSEENVLERYYFASKTLNAKTIIRVTGDNPLLDGLFVRDSLERYLKEEKPKTYLSTSLSRTYPLGMSVEIFSFDLLEEAFKKANQPGEFEHVTPYMHQNIPGDINIVSLETFPSKYHYRLTVDTQEDFLFNKTLIEKYLCDKKSLLEIVEVINDNQELLRINCDSEQKEWDKD